MVFSTWMAVMCFGCALGQTSPSTFESRRGQCLDAAWVDSVASRLKLDPNALDSLNRKVNPFLRPALKQPRYKLNDPRQTLSKAFDPACLKSGETIRGIGETVFPNGSVAFRGTWEGSVTIEYASWQSQTMAATVMGILIEEVVGYSVSYFLTGGGLGTTERMSSVGMGTCSPTHINPEVWTNGKLSLLNVFANETSSSAIGYNGRSGVYTLKANVEEALKGPNSTQGNFSRVYSADWWRDYTLSPDLINFYSIQKFNLSQVGLKRNCADGVQGCLDGCSRTAACTAALAKGDPCMLVAHQSGTYDAGYLQATMANNGIPAYFCFSGYTNMGNLVVDTMNNGGAIAFYHYEPDMFHYSNKGKFARISLPRDTPEMVVLSNGQFGANGFGLPSPDPVSVDLPELTLMKYYSDVLLSADPVNNFAHKFQLSELNINNLLQNYADNQSNPAIKDIEFSVACQWIKSNYETWRLWVDRLPLCSLGANVKYDYSNCNSTELPRVISFDWIKPDPTNKSLPYDCDGGFTTLPPPLKTSKSCAWLRANTALWSTWLTKQPTCDDSFYSYVVSECFSNSQRSVNFFWLVPDESDYLKSSECINGVALPSNTTIACDFIPLFSGVYTGIATITVIVMIVLVMLLVFVIKFREKPVIKRSQWHLLVILISGGMIICIYVLLGGGSPTYFRCAARPFFGSLGYTLCFGALLVKSLRVYLLFQNKAMKKQRVSVVRMLKILCAIVGLDIGIIIVWLIAEFPTPTKYTAKALEFSGTVEHFECRSSSFIFPVLSIFWKAVVTFIGLYLSFLIRHVDSDFQESIWIFAASCVVLVGSLLMMTMAYLVELPASVSYGFLSAITLFCTVTTMGLMLGPKLARLNNADMSTDIKGTGKPSKTYAMTSAASQSRAAPSSSIEFRETTT